MHVERETDVSLSVLQKMQLYSKCEDEWDVWQKTGCLERIILEAHENKLEAYWAIWKQGKGTFYKVFQKSIFEIK